jgi:hypothetical protein
MTPPPLSPAAQAVFDAFVAEARPEPHHQQEAIAAAIRAAANQVAGFAPTGGRAWTAEQAVSYSAISAAVHHLYAIAAQLGGYEPDQLAIAAELDGTANTTETP